MKRFTIFLIATISTILAISAVATSNFSLDDKHAGHHQEKDKAQKPQARVDGAVNPDLIPDYAAYEILFRLLSSTIPEEKKELRKSAYLKGAGYDSAEASAIANAAYEYKRKIEPLDTEVDNIKNAHWPNPSTQVIDQLTELQKQKETIISDVVDKLQGQLDHYSPTKFKGHVKEIKQKTKGFSSALPTKDKKIGRLGNFFSNLFTVSAQACDAYVYLYNNVTIDWESETVWSSGSYSMPYNSCGHTISSFTNMWGPSGTGGSGSEGAFINLFQAYNNSYLDGNFLATTEFESFCLVVNQTSPAGSATGDAMVAPYLIVKPFGAFNPASIMEGGQANIQLSVTASQNATSIFNVEFSYQLTQGNTPVIMSITGSSDYSIDLL